MQIQELSINPISINPELNPALWSDMRLLPEVRLQLLRIARHFADFLKVTRLNLVDITISGSNAGYNYNQFSDIDLHLVVKNAVDNEELFTAKKNQYNFTYDINLNGVPVELYVQDSNQVHHSTGIYSVLDNKWLSLPKRTHPEATPEQIKSKARNYAGIINQAMRSQRLEKCEAAMEELRRLRKAGLEQGGEQSVENLAFKLLRARGQIDKLRKYINKLTSAELSLGEQYEDQ
jgi:hypothetical protein